MSAWEDARASLTACTKQVQHDHCGYLHRVLEHLRLAALRLRSTRLPAIKPGSLMTACIYQVQHHENCDRL